MGHLARFLRAVPDTVTKVLGLAPVLIIKENDVIFWMKNVGYCKVVAVISLV